MDEIKETEIDIKSTGLIEGKFDEEASSIYGLHPPLDPSRREIRVISVRDSEDTCAVLSGQLERTTLHDDYSALSYVWGDEHDRRPIQLNGVSTTITANLDMALKQLRAEKKATRIWVDAICINQRDNTEKAIQVQMMGDIYRHANTRTIIWLGEAEKGSKEAMELISTVDKQFFANYNPLSPPPALQGVRNLLKRPWWKRMWVIQEMMLSPHPILKCGTDEADFERIVDFRNLHWEAEHEDLERFQNTRDLWRECPFTSMLEHDRNRWLDGELGVWLMDVSQFQCRYLRDKVYGLLGLIHPDIRKQITVSYDESVTDKMVLLEATRICFHREGLLSLQMGQVEKDTSLGLPSWCPDWTSEAMVVPFVGFGFSPYPVTSSFQPPDNKWLFGKDQVEKPTFAFSRDTDTLFLHGFVVDTIGFVDGIGTQDTPEPAVYTGDNVAVRAQYRMERLKMTKAACLRWKNHVETSNSVRYSNSDGGNDEAFCRTIVGNRSFGKGKLNPRVKPVFDAWVGRDVASDNAPRLDQEHASSIQDYSNSVVSRCDKRNFITTISGYFGLAPQKTKVGDLVCIVYGANVAFVLREPEPELEDEPGSFVGETYLHGVMQGEYLEIANREEFTGFWLK